MVRSEEELRRLATPEFSRLLASDPELQRLNALKYDSVADYALLLETFAPECEYRIGQLSIRPLTAAKWSLLWLLGSPFVTGGNATEADCSTALYILNAERIDSIAKALCEIPVRASGYAEQTTWSPAQIAGEIRHRCDIAFRPLALLPPPENNSDCNAFRFDALWLNRVAGIAAKETNSSLFDAMHLLPLSMVCCCYVNYIQRTASGRIQLRHRPNVALAERISARIAFLEGRFLEKRECRRNEREAGKEK